MTQGFIYPNKGACPFYRIKGCDSLYIDFLTAPKEVVRLYAVTPIKKRKGPRGGVSDPFPNKLREMLSAASHEGLDEVVAWKDHGRSFGIYDSEGFVRNVLPRFFKQTKLTSFQRQLNLYGFLRVSSGPEQGCYYHPMFLRSRPDLLSIMIRDRTNPWTKLVEPHEATACTSFADIDPQCSQKAVTSTPIETLTECKDNESVLSIMGDDLDNFLDAIFDMDLPDDVFDHTSKTDQVPTPTTDTYRERIVVSDSSDVDDQVPTPTTDTYRERIVVSDSSDVDDYSDDESLTGVFAGQRFHCMNNEAKVLAMEEKVPIYYL